MIGGLLTYRLTGERRFVDAQRDSLEQFAVGRNLFSGGYDDDVTDNDIFFRYLDCVAVSDHLNRLVVIYLIQKRELAVGLQLEKESQTGGEQDRDEYADRFEKD